MADFKAREFWIKLAKYHPEKHHVCKTEPLYLGAYGHQEFYEKIRVREIVPNSSESPKIDWEKVWREFTGHDLTDFEFMHKIQALVEKQLKGE